jgi:hypothetical protein
MEFFRQYEVAKFRGIPIGGVGGHVDAYFLLVLWGDPFELPVG